MKPLALYFPATTGTSDDVLDDDLAAWLRAQAQARAQSEPSPRPRRAAGRLVSAIRSRLPLRRAAVRIARRPA